MSFNLLAQGEPVAYVLDHSDVRIVFASRDKRKYGSVGMPVGNSGKVIRPDGSECAPLEAI